MSENLVCLNGQLERVLFAGTSQETQETLSSLVVSAYLCLLGGSKLEPPGTSKSVTFDLTLVLQTPAQREVKDTRDDDVQEILYNYNWIIFCCRRK